MKIMLSAGETSGDIHGAAIAQEIKRLSPTTELFGFGGNLMAKESVRIIYNYRNYNLMNVVEVIKKLPKFLELLNNLTELIRIEKPDLLVLIDYPDFNWQLAKRAKKLGVKILSYIPPSAWAWRKSRAKSCTQIAGEFISIFPFELPIYQQAGAKISFLGNPLVDIAKPSLSKDSSRKLFNLEKEDRVVLLLPGSRSQEIKLILPAIIESARMISIIRPTRFFLLAAENIDQKIFQKKITASGVPIEIVKSAQRYDLMSVADAAIATSGTIVLEAALLNLPCVVLYKMSAINFFLAKLLVDTKFISLPNILANKKILIELIQNDVNPLRIVDETLKLYRDNKYRAQIVKDLNDACEKLGKPGAITRIVKKILEAAQS